MRKVIVQESKQEGIPKRMSKAEGSPDLVNLPDQDNPKSGTRHDDFGNISVTARSTGLPSCCNAYRLLYRLVTGYRSLGCVV